MIKFIIGLIAVVFIVLVAYMFTQSSRTAEHKVAKKVETKVTTSHKVEKPKIFQPKVKEHFSSKVEKKDVMDKVIVPQKSTEVRQISESRQDESIQDFEDRVAKEFTSQKYTGKVYGKDDFSESESEKETSFENSNDTENVQHQDYEQDEIDTSPNGSI